METKAHSKKTDSNVHIMKTLQQLKYQLAVNVQAIRSPHRQICYATLFKYTPEYIQYNPIPWNTPNNGIHTWTFFLVSFWGCIPTNEEQKEETNAIKHEFDTMVEVNKNSKNQIELTVDDT